MTTVEAPPYDIDIDSPKYAHRVLSSLHEARVADHLVGGQPRPTPGQVALTLRALADFPLTLRMLPSRVQTRTVQGAPALSEYLATFAGHLSRHHLRAVYDPRYWIMGELVTTRLMGRVSTLPSQRDLAPEDRRPTAQQCAAVLLSLADERDLVLPGRMVEVAADGDLPWNGATGIGLLLHHMADYVTRQAGASAA